MSAVRRIIKRLIIIFVYLAILAAVGIGFYFLFRTKPTCTDKIQNQGEERVDCGGPCSRCEETPIIEDLRISEKGLIPEESAKYDALVRITNPNAQFGVAVFEYAFNLLDEIQSIFLACFRDKPVNHIPQNAKLPVR